MKTAEVRPGCSALGGTAGCWPRAESRTPPVAYLLRDMNAAQVDAGTGTDRFPQRGHDIWLPFLLQAP